MEFFEKKNKKRGGGDDGIFFWGGRVWNLEEEGREGFCMGSCKEVGMGRKEGRKCLGKYVKKRRDGMRRKEVGWGGVGLGEGIDRWIRVKRRGGGSMFCLN